MPGTDGVEITGPSGDRYDEILTPEALGLIAALQRELGSRRAELLAARERKQAEIIAGGTFDFLPETAQIREDTAWQVAPPAPGLADFEDASSPLWGNVVTGQLNLRDALDRTIDFSQGGKEYKLRPDDELPTIVPRPRGWHLDEKHITVDGQRASGSLVDFALYMATSAQRQLDKGKGPYFYLPKNESHLEARLWNDAFNLAQDQLGIPRGTIRATVLIETIPAAFEMEEILYELRDHSAGLNAGRWGYLFSAIKCFPDRREMVLPDRGDEPMTVAFMH